MFFKLKKKWLITSLIIISSLIIIIYQNNTSLTEDLKEDGLLFMQLFKESNIETERVFLNYSEILSSGKGSDNIDDFKAKLEQDLSINLALTSDPAEKDVIEYQGQKKVESVPNANIQIKLASVLHENGKYKVHLMISLSNKLANEKAFLKNYAYFKQMLESVSEAPKIKINIQGSIDQELSHETQQQMIMKMFDEIGATVSEGLNEEKVISLTGLSKKLSYTLGNKENQFNVQIASRYDQIDDKTTFTIGTPIIIIEY